VNGQGRRARLPLWLVVLLTFLGAIATSSAWPIGLLWVALVSARLALIGRDHPLIGPAVRQALVALAIGVTPQMIFLVYFNAECSNVAACEGEWEAKVAWYEESVYWLDDHLHKFLLPSFYIAAPVALLMFWLTIRSPRLRAVWNRTQGAARFVGLVFVAAGTFTLMSATASGKWDPDTRTQLQSRFADETRSEVSEALYQEAKLECSQPNSQLLAATRAVENRLNPSSNYDRLRARSAFVDNLLDQANLPPRAERPAPTLDMTLSEARKRLPAATQAAREAKESAEAARAPLVQLISGGAMAALDEVGGLGLLGELLDGAAERLTDQIVANNRNLQKFAGVLATLGASGSEAIGRVMTFRPTAFTGPLLHEAAAMEKKTPPIVALTRIDREPFGRIEDRLRDRAEFHPVHFR
jgi:hypothetical protein